MPLAFDSLSHGTIAFGFFNIDTDLLLCDRYFLFAGDFCDRIGKIAASGAQHAFCTRWQIQMIEAAEDIGDLTGAIHGVRFTGFIGEVYRSFPFPLQPKDFKQNPAGFLTRSKIVDIISGYAKLREITLRISAGGEAIAIGDYRFNRLQFQELLKYVWRGGYPRWKDDLKPDYVLSMKAKILGNPNGLFAGMSFD